MQTSDLIADSDSDSDYIQTSPPPKRLRRTSTSKPGRSSRDEIETDFIEDDDDVDNERLANAEATVEQLNAIVAATLNQSQFTVPFVTTINTTSFSFQPIKRRATGKSRPKPASKQSKQIVSFLSSLFFA